MTENSNPEEISKLGKLFEKFGGKFLKSKVVKIFFAGFFLIFFGLSFFPILLNNEKLRDDIEQRLKVALKNDIQINGDVKFSILPFPSITMENILLKNFQDSESERIYNLFIKSVQIKFSFFNHSEIEELKMSYPIVQTYISRQKDEGYDDISYEDVFGNLSEKFLTKSDKKSKKINSAIGSKIFSFGKIKDSQILDRQKINLSVIGGTALIYDKNDERRQIDALNFNLKSNKNRIVASGRFGSENIENSFDLLAKFGSESKKPDSFLTIASPFSLIKLEGNIASENKGFLSNFDGKILVQIDGLRDFYKSYINNNETAFGKIKSGTKPIKISGDVRAENGNIAINNLLIISDLIGGKGEVEISLSQKTPVVNLDLDLDKVDLDSIWSAEAVKFEMPKIGKIASFFGVDNLSDFEMITKKRQEKKDAILKSSILGEKPSEEPESEEVEPINVSNNQLKNFHLSAEISVKEVKYYDRILTDAQIYLTLSPKGEMMILPMTIHIPGGGLFIMNGVFEGNSTYPKFIGHFDLSGKSLKEICYWFNLDARNFKPDNLNEYRLVSDIMMIPNLIKFGSLYLNLNKDQSEFFGEMSIDSSEKIPEISTQLKISNINLDDYITFAGSSSYLSPGSLLTKFLWLNDISTNNKVDLFFDKVTYKDTKFLDQSFKGSLSRGYVNINELSLKSDDFAFTAAFKVDISNEVPQFELKVDSQYLYHQTPVPAPIKDEKGDLIKTSIFKPKSLFDNFFSLPSFEGFKGNISFKVNELEVDDFFADNFAFNGIINNGDIEKADLKADIFEGKLSYQGAVSLKREKTINGSLSLNNATVEWLLHDIVGLETVDGIVNIAANFNSIGSTKKEFLKNLRGSAKFNVNSPKVTSYGLNDLISKMLAPRKYSQELRDPEKILFNQSSNSVFKSASGSLDFDGSGDGKIASKIAGTAVNSVLLGKINLVENSGELNFNTIFLVGTKQKPAPINISTNLRGDLSEMVKSTNIDQVKQYLGLIKTVTKIKEEQEIKENRGGMREVGEDSNTVITPQVDQGRINEIIKRSSLIKPEDMGISSDQLKQMQ
jgi:hypothetical protein